MESVILALASNEHYFPGLYCAVASALSHVATGRDVQLLVIDGGISQASRHALSQLVDRINKPVQFEFLDIDDSIFSVATPGPGNSHMAYCRILLPQLLDVHRLVYLDCDVLVFRDLSDLFDLQLPPGKAIAAVPDSETVSLEQDSRIIANAMQVSSKDTYFNSGVMLLDLNGLRKENFTEHSLEFLKRWKGYYRFHEQSVFNFLLHGRIAELPEYWNRPSWRFDQQRNNDLDYVLHYTTSAPWLGGTPGPAQELFERFAAQAGLPVNRQSPAFRKSTRQRLWRNRFAPLRVFAFPLLSLLCWIVGRKDKAAAYRKAARYWFDYIRRARARRELHRRRCAEVKRMKFDLGAAGMLSKS